MMNGTIQKFLVPASLLSTIGTLWARTPSGISPFQYGEKQAIDANGKQALALAGICDANGQILPVARPVLDVLGTATAFTRMYLSGGPVATECIVYFAPDGTTASLMNRGGDMEITCPAAAPLFVEAASQGIGSSVYRSVPFEAVLNHDESVVLLGMIDIQRKLALQSIAGEKPSGIADSDIPALLGTVSQKGENNQWFSTVMLDLLSMDGIPSEDRVRVAADSLVQKGWLVKHASFYRLADLPLALARRMLILDSALTLTAGYLGKGGLLGIAGFTCLEAGIHDLLVIDAGTDSVTLQSVSSAGVLDTIRIWFTDVHVHESLDAPVTRAGMQPTRKFCPQCGAAIQPGRKFCGSCGAKI